ncbi:hypothetical protein MY3296_001555 [Beauveria thailandica]
MKFSLVAVALASTVYATCHNSVACLIGGDEMCSKVCVRQGNPRGGRCLPRDGCPGFTICACYPKTKRGNDEGIATVNGDDAEARLWEEEVRPGIAPYVAERDLDRREVREAAVEAALRDVSGTDDEHAGEAAPAAALVATRSFCCSLLPPAKGLCCDSHCTYIGKPGGQCQDKGHGEVCYCN